VVDEYHGTKVTDDYQWLEKSDDPGTVTWMKEQTARARGVLDALPAAAALRQRIGSLLKGKSADYFYSAPLDRGRAKRVERARDHVD
jgi:prolyl oligopeptidase